MYPNYTQTNTFVTLKLHYKNVIFTLIFLYTGTSSLTLFSAIKKIKVLYWY